MSHEFCLEAPPPALRTGIEAFNQGGFFECHEILEALWMAEARPIRRLYQGVLQIGVAFYHLQAGRQRAAAFLLERGCMYLEPFAPCCMQVGVGHLMAAAGQCLAEVKRLGPAAVSDFDWTLIPKIEMGTEP